MTIAICASSSYAHSRLKTGKKLGSPNSFRRYDKYNMLPFPPMAMYLLRVTGTIAIAQPLFNFLTRTKNVYLVIIHKKTWYFSESKTIDVYCRGAMMYFPIFSDMLFWEACAKNVKYYRNDFSLIFWYVMLNA
jgi:hypothetical protein